MVTWLKRWLCKRFRERSTYAHLVSCFTAIAAVAFGLPWPLLIALVLISLIGAAMPDGSIRRR